MNDFWDWFWLMVWWFCFFAYLVLLFQIVGDLFRDHELSGRRNVGEHEPSATVGHLAALSHVIRSHR